MLEESEQIGAKLKAAREAQGLSLDDVIFRTQVPRSALVALENEDFSAFTSPVYAKSFLSQYSNFLNVDAQPWLEALQPGGFMPDGLLQPLLDAPDEEQTEKKNRSDTNSHGQAGLLSVLGLLALTGLLIFAVVKGHEFFESRFGNEGKPIDSTINAPPTLPANSSMPGLPVERPATGSASQSEGVPAEEDANQAPPRAIIVR